MFHRRRVCSQHRSTLLFQGVKRRFSEGNSTLSQGPTVSPLLAQFFPNVVASYVEEAEEEGNTSHRIKKVIVLSNYFSGLQSPFHQVFSVPFREVLRLQQENRENSDGGNREEAQLFSDKEALMISEQVSQFAPMKLIAKIAEIQWMCNFKNQKRKKEDGSKEEKEITMSLMQQHKLLNFFLEKKNADDDDEKRYKKVQRGHHTSLDSTSSSSCLFLTFSSRVIADILEVFNDKSWTRQVGIKIFKLWFEHNRQWPRGEDWYDNTLVTSIVSMATVERDWDLMDVILNRLHKSSTTTSPSSDSGLNSSTDQELLRQTDFLTWLIVTSLTADAILSARKDTRRPNRHNEDKVGKEEGEYNTDGTKMIKLRKQLNAITRDIVLPRFDRHAVLRKTRPEAENVLFLILPRLNSILREQAPRADARYLFLLWNFIFRRYFSSFDALTGGKGRQKRLPVFSYCFLLQTCMPRRPYAMGIAPWDESLSHKKTTAHKSLTKSQGGEGDPLHHQQADAAKEYFLSYCGQCEEVNALLQKKLKKLTELAGISISAHLELPRFSVFLQLLSVLAEHGCVEILPTIHEDLIPNLSSYAQYLNRLSLKCMARAGRVGNLLLSASGDQRLGGFLSQQTAATGEKEDSGVKDEKRLPEELRLSEEGDEEAKSSYHQSMILQTMLQSERFPGMEEEAEDASNIVKNTAASSSWRYFTSNHLYRNPDATGQFWAAIREAAYKVLMNKKAGDPFFRMPKTTTEASKKVEKIDGQENQQEYSPSHIDSSGISDHHFLVANYRDCCINMMDEFITLKLVDRLDDDSSHRQERRSGWEILSEVYKQVQIGKGLSTKHNSSGGKQTTVSPSSTDNDGIYTVWKRILFLPRQEISSPYDEIQRIQTKLKELLRGKSSATIGGEDASSRAPVPSTSLDTRGSIGPKTVKMLLMISLLSLDAASVTTLLSTAASATKTRETEEREEGRENSSATTTQQVDVALTSKRATQMNTMIRQLDGPMIHCLCFFFTELGFYATTAISYYSSSFLTPTEKEEGKEGKYTSWQRSILRLSSSQQYRVFLDIHRELAHQLFPPHPQNEECGKMFLNKNQMKEHGKTDVVVENAARSTTEPPTNLRLLKLAGQSNEVNSFFYSKMLQLHKENSSNKQWRRSNTHRVEWLQSVGKGLENLGPKVKDAESIAVLRSTPCSVDKQSNLSLM